MTVPVLESAVGLIVEDYRRRAFRTWDAIRRMGHIRIATPANRVTGAFLQQTLPEAQAVVFKDNAELDDLLTTKPLKADALLMPAEQAAAWTIRYPRFSLVIPFPILRAPFGYALPLGDDRLLTFFDAWLVNARDSGTVDALYRYWMLGEIGTARPPRWSIARDVLGWFH
jgi:ABC-type amino acid transport substrate-binding protein